MAGKCYNKLGDTFIPASLSKQTNKIRNLKIFASLVFTSFSSILCQYLKFSFRLEIKGSLKAKSVSQKFL